jgi:hypothetical protein
LQGNRRENAKIRRFPGYDAGQISATAQFVAGAKFSKNLLAMRGKRSNLFNPLTHSSSGLGHRPFTAATRVRIPYGSPLFFPQTPPDALFMGILGINPTTPMFFDMPLEEEKVVILLGAISHLIFLQKKCFQRLIFSAETGKSRLYTCGALSEIKQKCGIKDHGISGGGYIVIGLGEKDGRAILPPKGLAPEQIKAIQKEVLHLGYSTTRPYYHPVMEPSIVGGKRILIYGLQVDYFLLRLPVHRKESLAIKPEEAVTRQVTGEVEKLPKALSRGSLGRVDVQSALRLQSQANFRGHYLLPAFEAGLIARTIPDKPNSRLQKYCLAEKGRALLTQQ